MNKQPKPEQDATNTNKPEENQKNQNDLYLNSKKKFKPNSSEDYGYFFFPERFGNMKKPMWYQKYFSYGASRDLLKKNLCEQNVQNCIENRMKYFGIKNLIK